MIPKVSISLVLAELLHYNAFLLADIIIVNIFPRLRNVLRINNKIINCCAACLVH